MSFGPWPFCFRIVFKYPIFFFRNYIVQKLGSYSTRCRRVFISRNLPLLLVIRQGLLDKFSANFLLMKIPYLIMGTLNRRFKFNYSYTRFTLFLVVDVNDRLVRSLSSIFSQSSLKMGLCYLKTAVYDFLSSLNIWWIVLNVSTPDLPSQTHNLMTYRCLIVCCILSLFVQQRSTKIRSSLKKRSQVTLCILKVHTYHRVCALRHTFTLG